MLQAEAERIESYDPYDEDWDDDGWFDDDDEDY